MKRLLEKRKSNLFICLLFLMFFYVTTAGAVTVINGNDSGPGSLRDAISQGGIITFDVSSIGPTIILQSQLLLDGFYGDVHIQGPGADQLAINGLFGDPSSLIQVGYGVNAQISGLTFANANAGIQYGAAISNAGNLRLSECSFLGNLAARGGALYNGTGLINPVASMDIFNCQFLLNQADWGGAIYNDGNLNVVSCDLYGNIARIQGGGAIFNYQDLVIENSELINNQALSGGGGAIQTNGGNLVLNQCELNYNEALNNGHGGAIYGRYPEIISLGSCTLRGNRAATGGAIRNYDNTDYSSPLQDSVSLILTECLLMENEAYRNDGGAIYNNPSERVCSINDCIIRNNSAVSYGGGIEHGNNILEVNGSTLMGNISQGSGTNPVSSGGGGIYIGSSGRVELWNCTITGNIASSDVGSGGGGILNMDGNLKTSNCTITGNYSPKGGGLSFINSSGGEAVFTNTIVAFNDGIVSTDIYVDPLGSTSCQRVDSYCNLVGEDPENLGDETGTWFDGYPTNIILSDDMVSTDVFSGIEEGPEVGAPGNTEKMQVFALQANSLAVDSGNKFDFDGDLISEDQRGVSRPQGNGYDIGAYELVPEPVYYSITTTSSAGGTIEPVSADVLEGTDKTFTVTVYDGYILGDLLDGDESVSADMVGNDYTFTNVEQDHTLSATFIVDPAMKEEAGVGDFQVEDEGIGSLSQGDLVPEEDIRSLNMDGITSEDIQEYSGDEGLDTDNFVSGVSFDVTYSNDEGNDIFALNVTLDILREDLGQDTCDEIDAGEDLAEAFFENVSIYKIVSPDAYDLFTVASEDQDLAEPVNFFEVTGDEESYHVSISMVIEDNPVPEGESAVEAVVSGLDNYFYVYDGVTDGKFTDPLVAVRKSSVQEPPADDDDDVDDSDTTAETPASSGDGNCNVGAFPAVFGLLMMPLLFLLRR